MFTDDEEEVERKRPVGRPKKQARGPTEMPSVTANKLTQKWAWGTYSPQECQALAAVVLQDIEAAYELGKSGEELKVTSLKRISKLLKRISAEREALKKDYEAWKKVLGCGHKLEEVFKCSRRWTYPPFF